MLRRLARPEALRSAFALTLVAIFALATSLTQSHVHLTAAERANLASYVDSGAPLIVSSQDHAKPAPANLPERDDTRCQMCQAQAAPGSYIAAQTILLDLPVLAPVSVAAAPEILAPGIAGAAWRSRAPPTA